MGQQMRVRIDGEYSEPGKVGRGVRQGCPLSPLLFNIYIEELVREAVEDLEGGIKVGGRGIKALRFADDQAMVAKSQKGLQAMMDRLDRTSREYGMKINIKKTKVLKISKGEETMVRINIGGKEIEQVKEFCYLGSVITTDAKCHREIRRRIAIGKEAFSKRRELLRGKVNRTLKIRMIKTLIWSVVLYGAETWIMRKEDIKRLEAFEMWTGYSYLHKTTIHRHNKLVTRASDSPRVLPKRQRFSFFFSRCPLSRCFTFRFPSLNKFQAGATLVFRHFLCPSFCLI